MASAKHRKTTFISVKLKLLKDQGDHLISAVGGYVNRIIATGNSWTQGGGHTVEYQELSQMIDTAVEFLCEKCDELTDLSSQSIPATASTATISYKQSTESVQPADETQLKSVLDRIAIIEETMCSFRSRRDTLAEQNNGIDQQLKELLSKLSELDKKYSSGFEQVKQQISDICETQDAIEQEQKTRLQSLEKQLQKISTAQNRQKEEMELQAELVENLVHVPNLLESVKENVDALKARIDEVIDDCSNKHKDIETVTRGLADKAMTIIQSVQVVSEGQDKMTILMKQLETRLQTMEAGGRRNEKYVQKQVEKGESNLRILCQMLNDRLRPLEQLRTCLNERASVREDNVKTLSQLIQEVSGITPRLQQLEMKSPGTRCGFTASIYITADVSGYDFLSQYMKPYCNMGENFNADRGIFTAPVDGLYVAAISIRVSANIHLSVSVLYARSHEQGYGPIVCECSSVMTDITANGVGIVDMKAGDALFSRLGRMTKNKWEKLVTFSCFLLA